MMSEPDGLGQKYIPLMESKIIEASKFDNLRIWVDGGITFEILPKLKDLNVSNVVMGRAIFNNRGERKG
jgi:pentose-5-phosphate-3-epimerase